MVFVVTAGVGEEGLLLDVSVCDHCFMNTLRYPHCVACGWSFENHKVESRGWVTDNGGLRQKSREVRGVYVYPRERYCIGSLEVVGMTIQEAQMQTLAWEAKIRVVLELQGLRGD